MLVYALVGLDFLDGKEQQNLLMVESRSKIVPRDWASSAQCVADAS